MPNLDTPIGPPPAGPTCPLCGGLPADTTVRLNGPQATGEYLCGNDHIWSTRWLIDPPPLSRAVAS